MNEIQCLLIALLLVKRVLERIRERGRLTADERMQILRTVHLLTNQILSNGLIHELGQIGELLGQLEVPRIQDGHLE